MSTGKKFISTCENGFLKGVLFNFIESVPIGKPIGNGETNASGQNIVRGEHNGIRFCFLESQVKFV